MVICMDGPEVNWAVTSQDMMHYFVLSLMLFTFSMNSSLLCTWCVDCHTNGLSIPVSPLATLQQTDILLETNGLRGVFF